MNSFFMTVGVVTSIFILGFFVILLIVYLVDLAPKFAVRLGEWLTETTMEFINLIKDLADLCKGTHKKKHEQDESKQASDGDDCENTKLSPKNACEGCIYRNEIVSSTCRRCGFYYSEWKEDKNGQ